MSSQVKAKANHKVDLFFAFVDGVYDYVCAECTALCCKGHGFGGSLEREMRPLFARYPQLETMALSRTGDQIIFATTGGGCIMLDTDNFCRIEKELGKDKKPNICNLFPFNSFTQVGKTVVVMPHFLCPLRASVPARPGQVQGTHALVEAGIRQSGILTRDYLKAMVPAPRLHGSAKAIGIIERERIFRDLCAQGIGRQRFSEVLMAASAEPGNLNAFLRRAAAILGYSSAIASDKRDSLDDLLIALASPYRIGFLDFSAEEILRILGLAEITARRAWSGAPQAPTLQGLANTVGTFRGVQSLLASGDQPFDFGRVTQKTFSFRDSDLTFAAFITVQRSAHVGVLAALEEAIPADMSVADRSVLLVRLGDLMQTTKQKTKRKNGAVVEKILAQDEGHEDRAVPSMAA